MPIVEALGCPIYLVTSNGARIHSPTKELIFSFDINSDSIKSILDLDIDSEFTTVLFKEKVWQSNKENKKLNSFQTVMNYPFEIVDFKLLTDFSAIKLFFTHNDHYKLVELKDRIMEDHSDEFHYAFSLPFCLEFMDKSVDKSDIISDDEAYEVGDEQPDKDIFDMEDEDKSNEFSINDLDIEVDDESDDRIYKAVDRDIYTE